MHITHRARAAAAGAAAALTLVGLLTGCSSSGGSGTTTITLSMQNANVEKSDPATWAISALALAGVSVAACALPAWRAARLDPNAVLRAE